SSSITPNNTSSSITPGVDIEDDETFPTFDESAINRAPTEPFQPTEIDNDTLPFPQDNPWLTVTEEETGTKPPLLSRLWQSHVHKDEFPISQDVPDNKNVGAPLAGVVGGNDPRTDTTNGKDPHTGTMNRDDQHTVKQDMGTLDNRFITENVGAPLAGALSAGDEGTGASNVGAQNDAIPFTLVSQSAITEASRRLPSLRVIGQLSQSYIVT